jgi:hypothetical protein
MLMQVLSLTPDQINALPPDERNAIQQLVSVNGIWIFKIITDIVQPQRNQFIGGITA